MRIKVLYIGHAYIPTINRKKLHFLGTCPAIDLTVLVPCRWPHYLQYLATERSQDQDFSLIIRPTFFEGFEARYVFRALFRIVRRIAPNIIHVEQGSEALSYTQSILAKQFFAPGAKMLFFTWWNLERKSKPYWRLVERFNLAHSDYAIAGNHDALKILRQKGFDKPIKVLPQLGVDTGMYRSFDVSDLKRKLRLEGFVIGFAGRFLEQKGLLALLEAFALLEGPRTLLLVGRGDLKEALVKLACSLGVGEQVRFVDTVPHEEVPRYMNCMDVMVLPSQTMPHWKEQFGHVLIEAMACETPVIGSDSGEIPNVIGDAGLIFREGDVDDLAQKLQLLMNSPSLRAELAVKGRQRVLEKYTHRRIAEETYRVYQELMSGE